jgi:hypothetical protein
VPEEGLEDGAQGRVQANLPLSGAACICAAKAEAMMLWAHIHGSSIAVVARDIIEVSHVKRCRLQQSARAQMFVLLQHWHSLKHVPLEVHVM